MVKTVTTKQTDSSKKLGIIHFIKASIFGVFISLVLVLIFAMILRFTNLTEKAIRPINTAIKAVSILIAVIYLSKKCSGKMFLKGAGVGLVYFVLSFLVFSCLDGSFVVNLTTLTDLGYDVIIGVFSGIICSIFKK